MDEHPNVKLIRDGFIAFGSGEMGTLSDLLSDDAVWHIGGNNILAGDHRGKTAVLDLFGRIQREADRFEIDVHDVLANDTHAVVLARVMVARGGSMIHEGAVYVFHVKDGQVTECWVTNGDQYATDRIWAGTGQ